MERLKWIRCNAFLTSAVLHASALILLGVAIGGHLPGTSFTLGWSDADMQELLLDEIEPPVQRPELPLPLTSDLVLALDQAATMPEVREPRKVTLARPKSTEVERIDFQKLSDTPVQPKGETGDEVPNRPFGVLDQVGANQAAAVTVTRALGSGIEALRQMPEDQVVVVRGSFDQIETVLELYKIPFSFLGTKQPKDLKPYTLLCVNCGAQVKDRYVLKRFVTSGGWIVSSDWAVGNIVPAFPQAVRLIHNQNPDTTVRVKLNRTTDNADLLRGVPADGRWWLEQNSFFPAVDPRHVKVLVTSAEMKRRFKSPIVAFDFRPGQGRVVHLVGHFYQQQGTQRGLVAMHRLILNVILAKEKERQRRDKPLARKDELVRAAKTKKD